MAKWFKGGDQFETQSHIEFYAQREIKWPLPNVWLGASVEDQATADERIPLLLETPAAIRFVSYEPALGAVDFWMWLTRNRIVRGYGGEGSTTVIDWIIAGGESGPGARPPHPDWFRSVRDQCIAAGVPFFFKQWGEYCDWDNLPDATYQVLDAAGELPTERIIRVGKKKAGAFLDGREWKQFPADRTPQPRNVERTKPRASSQSR